MPISAKPAKKPARGPSVAPASANTEPAELKCRVRRTKPYDTNITPIVAIRKASGTARPISPATAVPLSAIAAVGAMIASDNAIASMNRSSLRSPCRSSIPVGNATPSHPNRARRSLGARRTVGS